MLVTLIPLDYIDDVWPEIEAFMEGAAKYTYGRFNAEDIKAGLKNNIQQLWVAFDESNKFYGAVVTEVIVYPRMTTLVMHFTGGIDLPRWKQPMLETLQRFAKENGCKVIESYGRSGWERVFKNDGFKKRFMYYELPVEN
jgi:hypothetical protein